MKIKGIARYPHLITPSAPTGSDKLKYSIQVLIHKNDPQIKELNTIIDTQEKIGFPNGIPKENDKVKYRTFFEDLAISEPENESLKDYMCLKASTNESNGRPVAVQQQGSSVVPITDPSLEISGKVVWIDGNASPYIHPLNSGIAFYLNGTLVTNEMGDIPIESISTKQTAEQMFRDVIVTNNKEVQNSTPVPPSPPAPPSPPLTTDSPYKMTDKANGQTREAFISSGWTDEQLISEGYMVPPNGVNPSFV